MHITYSKQGTCVPGLGSAPRWSGRDIDRFGWRDDVEEEIEIGIVVVEEADLNDVGSEAVSFTS